MTDGVFNISKGAFAEKIRDAATNVGVLLLQANEAEAAMRRHADVAALLAAAGNTEADFASYARKTGITGTVTVDNVNDRVDCDLPDQTWTAATTGQTMTKAIVFYEESASDAGRVPMTDHDYAATTNGNDLVANVNAAGFARAA
jgi:hypothetical protein